MQQHDTAGGAADYVPAPRRGRPRSNHAQDAIKAAASRLFAKNGITSTSVRDIATEAGVDPALVIRHFGSKEALFLQTMTISTDLGRLVGGPLGTLGRTTLQHLFEDTQESILPIYRALLGAIERPDVRAYVETALEKQLIEPLRDRLAGPDRDLRARLIAAQINGLLLHLAVAPDPVLTATPAPLLLDTYARALQALIDDPRTHDAPGS
ncbi:TetR family transcriptional regulator [Dactylosporangium sp. NPDC005572]|uniref:TetR/AcrR family transcriptional regulator n=1 Tax=Dactylosporangium sp. NPDC005572 TaxID=3156889 RepID=UPI0033B09FC4